MTTKTPAYKKRIFLACLILVAVLAVPAAATRAYAAEAPAPAVRTYGKIRLTEVPAVAPPADQSNYFESPGAALDYIREHLIARDPQITIYVPGEFITADSVEFSETFEVALYHSGNPKAGDYLRWQIGAWGYEGSIVSYDDVDYLKLTYTADYYTTAEQEAWVDQKVEEIKEELKLDYYAGYDCVNKIYRYITSHVDYDYEHLNDEDYNLKYTAYGALHDGKAVCQGYAALFYRLAWECHVDTRIVAGTAGEYNEPHAWNIVRVGEKDLTYNLDCTWDAGNAPGTYRYFMRGEKNFTDHVRDAEYTEGDFAEWYPMDEEDYLIPMEFEGEVYKSGDWSYQLSGDGNALITKYSGTRKNITVPAKLDGHPVRAIGKGVFNSKCTAETITLSEGIQGWFCAGESAFDSCPNLKTVNLPSTAGLHDGSEYDVILNGDRFYRCQALTAVTVAEDNPYLKAAGGVLFTKDGKVLLSYPAGAPAKSYTVPDGTAEIGDAAFRYQACLQKIRFPGTLDTIGWFSFQEAEKLSDVVIPESCTYIGEWAFEATAITSIHIPANVEEIIAPAFASFGLKTVTVAPENPTYFVRDGVLYSKKNFGGEEWVTLECYPPKRRGDAFAIPDDVNRIGFCSFWYAQELESIYIPPSVTESDDVTFMTQLDPVIYGAADSAAEEYARLAGCGFRDSDHIIKRANTLKVTPRKPSLKYKVLKKRAQTILKTKVFKVSAARGKVTYKLTKVTKAKYAKYFKVSSAGKITVRRKLPKGTYRLRVKVSAAGTDAFKAGYKTVTVSVVVK